VEDSSAVVGSAMPGALNRDNATGQGCGIVSGLATPIRQQGRKYMSKRSGQKGSVRLVGQKWVGRYWVDVPGESKRAHPAVVLGIKKEMTKAEARRKLMDIIATNGSNTDRHIELAPVTTFNSVADRWELKRLPTLKASTQWAAPLLLKKHLRPFFGQMPIENIKTGIVNDWIAGLNRKLQPKTVHNMWKMFRAVMNWHAQQNDEPQRKWYPTLPIIPEYEQRWFTQEEIGRLVDAASGQYRVLFHLAGFSGLRAGELFGLHVEDVLWNRGMVRVRRSVWRGEEVTTKTKKSFRDVLIDSGTVQMLRQHLGSRTSGRVFQSRGGTPLDTSNVLSEVLYPLCDKLSIPRGGLHAFRHGRVSHLQANNVPGDFTKAQVGHSSLKMTSNYTHFSEQFQRETVERLASKLTCCTQSEVLYSVAMPARSV
jgi:integrase